MLGLRRNGVAPGFRTYRPPTWTPRDAAYFIVSYLPSGHLEPSGVSIVKALTAQT